MRCKDCRDTGFTLEGFDVEVPRQPDPAADSDKLTQWVLSLTSCSHPNAPQDGPGEDTPRTVEVSSRVQRGRRGSDRAAHADGSPPAGGAG